MIFERQKRLLALLDAIGGSAGSLDFQKLLFLYCQEAEEKPSYEFVPYRFGGFSFTSYADKRKLIAQELLEDVERSWKLTEAGRQASRLPGAEHLWLDPFTRQYKDLRGDALVAEVYRKYPWHATRSEIAHRVLAGDAMALAAIAAARPPRAQRGICTIGYEGRSLEGYLNCLLRNSVSLLCDVRRNPLSRKYGFSKGSLSKGCEGVGIHYEHLPELGIDSAERRGLKTQADYDALFQAYERDSLPNQSVALERIRGWVAEGHRVALTCFEHSPEQCHRNCVANALERDFGSHLSPLHI